MGEVRQEGARRPARRRRARKKLGFQRLPKAKSLRNPYILRAGVSGRLSV